MHEDPIYFQIPGGELGRMQSIPVGWHRRPPSRDGVKRPRAQVLAITVKAIAGWIRAMQKFGAQKNLYPLIQAKNEAFDASRVTKNGHPLWSSLAFMDFDGYVDDVAFQKLQERFDFERLGVSFRSFTEGRAKVALVVIGTPAHTALKEFVEKMYFKMELLKEGITYPDCSHQALTTAFIPSEKVLTALTKALPGLRLHDVDSFNRENQTPEKAVWTRWPIASKLSLPRQENPESKLSARGPGCEIEKDEPESAPGFEDEDNVQVLPYTTPVDMAYLQANWGSEIEQPVCRLDAIQLGGGWVRGWADFEGPLPEWMLDKECVGNQVIKPKSVDGKLLRWLLGNAKAVSEAGIDIPQVEVAEYYGVSQQAISKAIKKFLKRGWLTPVPHVFPIAGNTDLEALGRVPGLKWNSVMDEMEVAIAVELHGHWSYNRSVLITAAMGYPVGPKAIRYKTLDMGFRFACLEVLQECGKEKTLEVVEELLGPPECQTFAPGHWHESLWGLVMTGHFQKPETWFDYCSRIPGINDFANSPRIAKLDLIWSWVAEHWESVRGRA